MIVEINDDYISEFESISEDKKHVFGIILEQCISIVRIQNNYINPVTEISIDDEYLKNKYKNEIDYLLENKILLEKRVFVNKLGNFYIELAQKERKYLIKELEGFFLVAITDNSHNLEYLEKKIAFNAKEENQSYCWVAPFDAEIIHFDIEQNIKVMIVKKI